jgi:VCBS repeat-containing protein
MTEDAATLTASGNVLTNDTDVDSPHSFTVVGVNSATANVGSTLTGTYGTISIGANGSYTYTLSNSASNVQALNPGQVVSDVFTYTMSDGIATSSSVVTINITGTDDGIVLQDDSTSVVENAVTIASGNVLANDTLIDAEDQAVTAVDGSTSNVGSTLVGSYGSVIINSDGSYSYTLDGNNAVVNGLSEGATITESFTYTVADIGATDSSDATLTVVITGTNDVPVANADTGSVREDTVLTVTSNVLTNDTDADSSHSLTVIEVNSSTANVGSTITGSYGTINIGSDGSYTYTLNNSATAVQSLAQGALITDTFTYTISDGTAPASSVVNIIITGTNDAPVANADSNNVTEDAATLTASGNVLTNDTDVDSPHSFTVVGVNSATANVGSTLTGTYGTISIGANGSYTYTLSNNASNVQALNPGQVVSDTFTYTMSDGIATSSSVVTINITGSDDGIVLVDDNANVREDVTTLASGNVLSNDTIIDAEDQAVSAVNGSTANVGVAVNGTYGNVLINADGSYTYTLNNAAGNVQALANGVTVTETFVYTVADVGATDSSDATLTVVVTGTNDTPIATIDTGSVNEDQGATPMNPLSTIGGNVLTNDTDVDNGASLTVVEVNNSTANVGSTLTGTYGTINIGSDGSYTYILNNALTSVQSLAAGATTTDTFTYTMSDGLATSSTLVNIVITGTNDVPVANADSNNVTEDAATLTASGNVLTNDIDVDNPHSFTVVGVNIPNANVGSTVTGTYGTINIGSNGAYTYTLNNTAANIQVLNPGQVVTDVFTYTMSDGTATSASVIRINVTGSNDTITVVNDSASVREDLVLSATGNVLTNDTIVDAQDQTVTAVNDSTANLGLPVSGTYGSVTIGSNGAYIYTLGNGLASVQSLANGATVTDTFRYTVTDVGGASSSTATLTVVVTGTNDTPVANVDTGNVREDIVLSSTGNVLTNDTDADSGASLTVVGVNSPTANVGSTLTGTYGTISIDSNGAYTYTLSNASAAVQNLAHGATATDTFTYTISDGTATSSSVVNITVTGTNDAPVANANTDNVTEDGTTIASGNVLTNDTDVDSPHNFTVVGVNSATANVGSTLTGTYGTISIGSNGAYTYTLSNSASNVQALNPGQVATDTFTYTMSDGIATSSSVITINITGTDDGITLVNDSASVVENAVTIASGNVLTNDTLIDAQDQAIFAVNGSTSNIGSTLVGSYGSIIINSNGSYSYTLDSNNNNVESLAEGATLTETFTYTVADPGSTSSSDATLTVVITGTNDVPVANADSGSVTEDNATTTASGNVLSNDTDADSSHTLTVIEVNSSTANVGSTITGSYGTINIGSDGSYTYTLNNSNTAVQSLAQGALITDTFTYTISDGTAPASSVVDIIITGTNDAPVAVANTDNVTEDGTTIASGNVLTNDTDVDSPHSFTVVGVNSATANVGSTLTGTYGTISIGSNGAYTYTLSNTASNVQALNPGQVATDAFTYTMSDGIATSSSVITINVTGANDTITVVNDSDAVREDVTTLASGNVLTNDTLIDAQDQAVTAVNGNTANVGTTVAGTYGSVVLNSNGTYTYTLNNAAGNVQALANGATVTETFVYTVADPGSTSSSDATLTVIVTGTNDAPVAVANTDNVTEDGTTIASGNVLTNDTDVDNPHSFTVVGVNSATANVGSTLTGTYGTITIGSNGAYTYTLSNSASNVQALNPGQVATDTFTYTMSDGIATSSSVITINVTGSNDTITVVNDSDAVREDVTTLASGNVLTNDTLIDAQDQAVTAVNGNTANVGTTVAGTYGSVVLNSNGTYTYTLNNAAGNVQALANGATVTETFVYTVADPGSTSSSDATLTVVVTGTNDAPIANADTGNVNEDQDVNAFNQFSTINGNVLTNDTDTDTGASLTVVGVNSATANVGSTLTGTYGTINIGSNGTYTYILNNALTSVQSLAQGTLITDTFTYTISDGAAPASSVVNIIITGTNDAPIAVANTDNVTEDGTTIASGNVLTNDTDVDTGASLTVVGVNSATANVGSTLTGTYGTITIGSNGAYTYTLTNTASNVQALNPGQVATDAFTYTMSDGIATSSSVITINVTGANDTITVVNDSDAVREDVTTLASGNVLTNDTLIDAQDQAVTAVNGNTANVGTTVAGTYGSVVLNSNGTYTYTLNNAAGNVQALANGATVTETFTYTVADPGSTSTSTATLAVAITGTNDAPVAVANTDNVTEDGTTIASGNVLTNDTDVDNPHSFTVVGVNSATANVGSTLTGTYGTITIGSNGAYTYTLSNSASNVQALNPGQVATDTFTYTMSDGIATSSSVITINVTGSNDGITLANNSAGVTEDTAVTVSNNVLTNDTIIDAEDQAVSAVNGNTANVGTTVAGSYGSVVMNSDGSYTYTLNNGISAVQNLAAGSTITDTFTYSVADPGSSSSSTATLTVVVTGTNDAPVANADTGSVTEDSGSPASGNVLSNDTDTDTGASLTVIGVNSPTANVGSSVTGSYGAINIGSNGAYTYTLDNNLSAVQSLAQGATITDTFTYTISDGSANTSSVVNVVITGTNDAPVAVANTDNVTEDGTTIASGNVLTNDTDIDNPHSFTVVGVNSATANVGSTLTGTYGTINIGSNGSYTYTLSNSASNVQALNPGQVATDTFTYTMSDGIATSSSVITINVTGSNDGITLANNSAGVTEDTAVTVSNNVLTNDTLIDAQDQAVSAVNGNTANVGTTVAGSYGSVVLNSNGSYIYTLNNSATAVQALAQGATITDTFTYSVADPGSSSSSTATLTVVVTGTNDAPVAVADTDNVAASGTTSVSGNILTNDTDVDSPHNFTVTAVNGSTANIGSAITGTYGIVYINAAGAYTYYLSYAASNVLALNPGQVVTDAFTYTMSDGIATSSAPFVINITGANEGVTLTNNTASVTEDSVVTASNNVLTNDTIYDTEDRTVTAVNGNTANVGATVAGTYGSAVINSDGSYTYTLSNGATAVQGLAAGATATDVFSYSVADLGGGTTSTATLTVTVTGANDAPVANADSGSVTEDGTTIVSSNVLTNDTDADTSHSFTVVGVNSPTANVGSTLTGTYGTIAISSNGNYTYTLSNAATNVQALSAGQVVTDTFTYTMSDGTATSSALVNILVTGSNDAPVVNNESHGLTEESGTYTATGNALSNDSDVDNGTTLSISQVNGSTANVGVAVTGTYGSITLGSNGSYTYTLANGSTAVQSLAAGQTANDVYTYRVSDGTASTLGTITIAVTGANDAPSAVADSNGMTEDASSVTGNILTNDTDIDTNDSHTVTSINGSAANVGNPVTLSHGVLTVASNGGYTYALNTTAAQTLAAGATMTDSATYVNSDGHGGTSTSTLVITITGANDAPVVNNESVGFTEDTGGTATGNVLLNDSDIDNGAVLTITQVNGSTANVGTVITGTYGTINIGSTGGLIYIVSDSSTAVQSLAAGQTANDVYTYRVSDGTTSTLGTITLTITGVNDAPSATIDGNTITEDSSSVTGNMLSNDRDTDSNDTLTLGSVNSQPISATPTTITGNYGNLLSNSNGSYTYVLNNALTAVQALALGQQLLDTFNYILLDGQGGTAASSLVITVAGANDAPVATADSQSTDEDTALTINAASGLLANDTDVDSGATLTVTTTGTITTTLGATIAVNSDGSYVYDPTGSSTLQALTTGQTLTDTVTYTMKDNHNATSTSVLSIVVSGQNEATGPTGVVKQGANSSDNLESGGGNDLVVGDPGSAVATSTIMNVVYVIDTSTSMLDSVGSGRTRLDVVKESLVNLSSTYNDLVDNGYTVNVTVVRFNASASFVGSTLSLGGTSNMTAYNTLVSNINGITITGLQGTGYIAALDFVEAFFQGDGTLTGVDYENSGMLNTVYFLSDGAPRTPIEFIDTYNRGEWDALLASPYIDVYSVGIGGQVTTDYLDLIDNQSGTILVADSSDSTNLSNVLNGKIAVILGPTSSDTLDGGYGDDIIYGDRIETDSLGPAGSYGGAGTHDYAGYDVLKAIYGTDSAVLAHLQAGNAASYNNDSIGSADSISGGVGNDTIFAQGGDDWINAGEGNDIVYGGTGSDTLYFGSATNAVTVTLTDSVGSAAGQGTDTLYSIENVIGSSYNDVITGNSSNNTFIGGDGNDTVDGGTGIDVMNYANATAAVTVSLATSLVAGGEGSDTLLNIEGIIGSSLADTLLGDTNSNTFTGGQGNDYLDGSSGTDFISYTDATAGITVNFATGTVTGGAGTDSLVGIEGVIASSYNDSIISSVNNDTITGGAGADTVLYTSATAAVTVNLLTGTATGGAGSDVISGIENITGSSNADVLFGDYSNNTFVGGLGNDTMYGGTLADSTLVGTVITGFDLVDYSSATAAVTVNIGTTSATGGAGTDRIHNMSGIIGSAFNDVLTGTTSSFLPDIIWGGAGTDVISALAGTDTIYGGATARDTIDGGADADTANYFDATAAITLTLASATTATMTGGDTDRVVNIENIVAGAFNDVITGAANEANTIDGGLGNDTLNGGTGTGTDVVAYWSATAAVTANLGTTLASGGAGSDVITNFEGIIGSIYNDSLTGRTSNADYLYGGEGDDILTPGSTSTTGSDTVDGGAGVDTLYINSSISTGITINLSSGTATGGSAAGTINYVIYNIEKVVGSSSADSITGDLHNNILEGYTGNDYLDGGGGEDWVYHSLATTAITVDLANNTATGSSIGNDSLLNIENVLGTTGNDIITGNANNNSLLGSTGDDTINGGDGNDFINAGFGGTDTINGGNGIDTVTYRDTEAATVTFNVSAGNVIASSTTDVISALEIYIGGGLYNIFNAATLGGNYSYIGGSGTNVYNSYSDNDYFDGSASSTDTIVYTQATSAVTASLVSGSATGGAGTDSFIGIEHLTGSNYNDMLSGNNAVNIINGGSGNDTMEGGAGNDTLDGGTGTNTITYRYAGSAVTVDLSSNTATGGDGSDAISNFQNVTGSSYNDTLIASSSAATLQGGAGNDTLRSGAGNDMLAGGDDTDVADFSLATSALVLTISGTTGTITAGGIGTDTWSDIEGFIGGSGADTLTGDSNANYLNGGLGNDTIYSGGSADTIDGGAGTDIAYYNTVTTGITVTLAGATTATMTGGDTDLLVNIEDIVGSSLADTITGAANESNTIDGGLGNDTLNGGSGTGTDVVSFQSATAAVTVSIQTNAVSGGAGTDSISGFEGIIGSDYNDILTGRPSAVDYIFGGNGNDTITASTTSTTGSETIDGGAGIDYLGFSGMSATTVNLSLGTVTGGSGSSQMDYKVYNIERIAGSSNADVITGDSQDNTIEGAAGNDTIDGGDGSDWVIFNGLGQVIDLSNNTASGSTNGNDTLLNIENVIATVNADTITGDANNNTFLGGSGNDTLTGGDGNDWINGQGGTDSLYGGNGIDTADYSDTAVSLTFNPNLSNAISGGFTEVLSAFEVFIGGTVNNIFNAGTLGGNYTYIGGTGANVYNSYSDNDYFDGSRGSLDNVVYTQATSAVTVSLSAGTATGGNVGTDTLVAIETITGSNFNDTLSGDSGNNSINGGSGNDTLEGGLGNDTLNGGTGTNTITYQNATGAITLTASLSGVTGADGSDSVSNYVVFIGSGYNDVFNTVGDSTASRTLLGGAGNDTFIIAAANTTMDGGDGNDTFQGGSQNDVMTGGNGVDLADYSTRTIGLTLSLLTGTVTASGVGIDTWTGIEGFIGTTAADTMIGDANDNYFVGALGNDRIDGGTGNDTASYFNATSAVTVDLSLSTATGGAGSDSLISIEYIVGSEYDDTLTGTTGDNTIAGLGGNDILIGSSGTDTLDYSSATAAVTIDLSSSTAIGGAGNDSLSGFENAIGSSFNDTLTGDNNVNTLYGGTGADTLIGGSGADYLYGDDGDDILIFDSADNTIAGGAGFDILRLSTSGNIDLSSLDNSLTSGIEMIDLQSATAANTLTLSIQDVLDLSNTTNELFVTGNSGDVITSADSWTDTGSTTTVNGVSYNIYTGSGATLYVDQDINQLGLI